MRSFDIGLWAHGFPICGGMFFDVSSAPVWQAIAETGVVVPMSVKLGDKAPPEFADSPRDFLWARSMGPCLLARERKYGPLSCCRWVVVGL